MNIGHFPRGGRNRVLTKAEDHDLGVNPAPWLLSDLTMLIVSACPET